MPQLTILALDGCLASTVHGLIELVSMTNKIIAHVGDNAYQTLELSVVSLGGDPVKADGDVMLVVEGALGAPVSGGILLVPGCMTHDLDMQTALKERDPAIAALQAWSREGGIIAAHCSSVFLLAKAGLLNDRRATATWWAQDQMEEAYPYVELMKDETLTDDQNVICAAGPFSHLDLALHLIEKLVSKSVASLVAKFAMIERSPPNQSAFRTLGLVRQITPIAKRLETFVLQQLPGMPTIKDAAGHVGMTIRTLQRHTHQATGKSPQAYMNEVRMDLAKGLIETSDSSIAQLMDATGFVDESAFRRRFKRASGMTPKQYRDRYGISR